MNTNNEKDKVFWLNLDISFIDPFNLENEKGEEGLVNGALMEIGITCRTEDEALNIFKEFLEKDSLFANRKHRICLEHIGEIANEDIHSEIYSDEEVAESLIQDPLKKGIWYKTGFGFYYDGKP